MAKVGDNTGGAGTEDHTHELRLNHLTSFWGKGRGKHRHTWRPDSERTSVDHGHSHPLREEKA